MATQFAMDFWMTVLHVEQFAVILSTSHPPKAVEIPMTELITQSHLRQSAFICGFGSLRSLRSFAAIPILPFPYSRTSI
jgi:hypothetical protein